MKRLGENLKELRVTAGLTQQALADILGVTRGAVAQWEAGTVCPETHRITSLTSILRCSPDDIFEGVEGANSNRDEPEVFAKFWMVYGDGKGAPTYRHSSQLAAKEEAKRIAHSNPGVAFFVLEAVSAFLADLPKATEHEVKHFPDAEIPF